MAKSTQSPSRRFSACIRFVDFVPYVITLSSLFASSLFPSELLPPDRPIAEIIDYYVDSKLTQAKITPARQADDRTLVRRLTLDLVGRIPVVSESKAFIESPYPSKRARLIDRLMSSPGYIRHASTEFDTLLRADNQSAPSLRPYLMDAFRQKRPWQQMFAEMLGVASEEVAHKPQNFVLGRLADRDGLTRDVSGVFFGINISCCQCHDHPYVEDLTQDYYFGLKAFFHRSYEFHGHLLEKQYSQPLKFSTHDGQERQAKLIFISGTTVDEPTCEVPDLKKAIEEQDKRIEELRTNFGKDKKFPDKLLTHPRQQLVELAMTPSERVLLAKALVNRLWYRFFGYGLVMRIDQMHSKNPPSHPELLDWLTRDFIENGFDIHRLVRGIVSSYTYSRSSIWEQDGPPALELFAVADVRALTPMQYGVSLRLASNPNLLPGDLSSQARDGRIAKLEAEAQQGYVKFIDQPHEELQIGVNESLKLSNDPEVLSSLGDGLVPQLMLTEDRRELIETAVWSILSRSPTDTEFDVLSKFLASREPDNADRLKGLRKAIQDVAAIGHAKLQIGDLEKKIDTELARLRAKFIREELAGTSKYLAAAAEFHSVSRGNDPSYSSEFSATTQTLADRHNVHSDILRQWLRVLGFSHSKRKVNHFTDKLSRVMGIEHLMGLGSIKMPNVLINSSEAIATFNYGEAYRSITLPGKALAVHPSSTYRVGIGWSSPIDGTILLDGLITDIDKSRGNGVSWSIELRQMEGIKTIAFGDLENGKSKSLNSIKSIQVKRGDLLSIIVDARDGNDGCDTTRLEFNITEVSKEGRKWILSKEIVKQPHANNPYSDQYGNLFTWHIYMISNEESAVPTGSHLADWMKIYSNAEGVDEETRNKKLSSIGSDVQKFLTATPPAAPTDPNRQLYDVLASADGRLFRDIDIMRYADTNEKAEMAQLKDLLFSARKIASERISTDAETDVIRFRQGVHQVVWSLLTSSEFRFNY